MDFVPGGFANSLVLKSLESSSRLIKPLNQWLSFGGPGVEPVTYNANKIPCGADAADPGPYLETLCPIFFFVEPLNTWQG